MNDREVERAARKTQRRKREEPSRSPERVEASGERLAQRLGGELTPALVGVAVVAGAVAVALVVRSRRRHRWLAPARPSAVGALARTVGVSVLRLAAQHAARAVAQRLASAPSDEAPALEPVVRPQ